MNKVTLYQTTKSEHLTCRDQLELYQFSYQDITPIRASEGEFIIDQEVKKLQYPVQKYVFSQRDWKGNVEERVVYAAFDNELLELNTILKCAKEGVSVKGATIYTTLSCCSQCASMLASCGVKRVVYLQEYRDTKGIEVLKQCGIIVEKLNSEF